jgi:hypothetical protein
VIYKYRHISTTIHEYYVLYVGMGNIYDPKQMDIVFFVGAESINFCGLILKLY